MLALAILTCYLIGIATAINAVTTSRTSEGAIAWLVLLVSFPFVAVPAYLLLGRSKFEGFREAYESNREEIDTVIAEMRSRLAPHVADAGNLFDCDEALTKMTGNDFLSGNDLELLIDGEATFDSLFTGIAAAERYVVVQFYTIRNDGLGRRLKDALLERAKHGIAVYFLFDEIGSRGLHGEYLEELREAGVQVATFKPAHGNSNRFQLNLRNHRKIVVVDGRCGWVGGHNVADDYIGLNPDLSPWRDTHVRIQGPAVIQLQAVAISDWFWVTREIPELNWHPEVGDSNVIVQIVPSGPTHPLEAAGLMYVMALNSARHRIWLTAPYFVPDEAVMKALELAALRGVDVRVIIPGKSDSLLAQHAAFHYIQRLARLGIRFFEYGPGFLHEKVALVDSSASLVGTANFDNRSFRLNFEVTAVILDEPFAESVGRMLEADLDHARELDVAALEERGLFWQLKVGLARLAAPVL